VTREALKNAVVRHLSGSLSCIEMTEAVTDYLEARLGVARWLRFQMHLGLCLGCRIYLAQMKYTLHTLGTLPSEPAPAELRDQLRARFRSWKNRPRSAAP
jgi:hypothetical protein